MAEKRYYKNITELAEAFRQKHLVGYVLDVDNDCSFLRYVGPVPKGVNADEYRDAKNDECHEWFQGNGYQDIVDALNSAGIPADWV